MGERGSGKVDGNSIKTRMEAKQKCRGRGVNSITEKRSRDHLRKD
jgi:hypothetical protein